MNLNSDEIDKHTERFFNALQVKVVYNGDRIPVMKAYADDGFDSGKIRIVFTAAKSGTYNLTIRYNGFLIPGCPFDITITPDNMCAESTPVNLPCMPLLLTDGLPQTIQIFPRDSTGFPCSFDGVRLDKFDFHASTVSR